MGGLIKILFAGIAIGAVAAAAWAVRGRASSVFGKSVWHGPRDSQLLALTFDDGPSVGTEEILSVLADYGIPATFFQCGANVDALPAVARAVVKAGHEIGNHSYSHPMFALKSRAFVQRQLKQAQESIASTTGVTPTLLRAPYGVRWFGVETLPMTGVMWDVIGVDWKLPAGAIASRILGRVRNGSILCLHDGRELDRSASIANTVEALRLILPSLLERGFEFRTVSQLLCLNKKS